MCSPNLRLYVDCPLEIATQIRIAKPKTFQLFMQYKPSHTQYVIKKLTITGATCALVFHKEVLKSNVL